MKEIYLGSRRVKLDSPEAEVLGKGGEADVYKTPKGEAIKIYKTKTHPDLTNKPQEQKGAELRIKEHQKKLPELIKVAPMLPQAVVTPQELATTRNKSKVVGYSMPLVSNAEVLRILSKRSFHQTQGGNVAVQVLRELHAVIQELHKAQVVLGDFNDLNIMLIFDPDYQGLRLIDADSYQFRGFKSNTFTQRFVDPLHCEEKRDKTTQGSLMLCQPYSPDSDWYSFGVIAMQSLLLVDPYGGVYRPKDKTKKLPHDKRPLHRITCFHDEVRYAKPAIPIGYLPDDLVDHFQKMFIKDQRGMFPMILLENLRWTTCTICGTQHARAKCPGCASPAPAIVKEKVIARGNVLATIIFQTKKGYILHATAQNGVMHYLHHEDGAFYRDGGRMVLQGGLETQMRIRLQGPKTHLGAKGKIITIKADNSREITHVDSFGQLPVFDTNSEGKVWLQNSRILRDEKTLISGPEFPAFIGNAIGGQTLLWTGEKFGFGFYRAGQVCIAFVFDATQSGINDSVTPPKITGHLLDASCYFTSNYCWFLYSVQEGGKTVNHCYLYNKKGELVATTEADQGSDHWLSSIRGKCAMGNLIFTPTDEGIVRTDFDSGTIQEVKTFPDTEPFVNSGSKLYPAPKGIYVVGRRDIKMLRIS
jgi:hypothetical protein